MPSRFIHVAANCKILFFFWLSSIPLHTPSSLSISLLIDTWVASMSLLFQTVLLVNIGVHAAFWISDLCVFFQYILSNGIAGSYGSSEIFWETSILSPQWPQQFTFLPTLYEGSLSSISLPAFVICVLCDDNYSDRCEVIFHYGFDLHFPDD